MVYSEMPCSHDICALFDTINRINVCWEWCNVKTEFFVPGKPVGKGRPKFTKDGHAYTDDQTKTYEQSVAVCFKAKRGKNAGDAPVSVFMTAFYGIPKSWSKVKKERAKNGEIVPGKPDADNVAKAVLDGLNGVAYNDDRQVKSLLVRKQYCTDIFTKEGVHVVVLTGEDAK